MKANHNPALFTRTNLMLCWHQVTKKFESNQRAFSAAKNWQQMKAITQALIGEDGKLRTYHQFKQKAFEINDQHVNQWLKTEYDTAIAGGQMAGKWVDIENYKTSLPMLEFDAVMDRRTSQLCSSLNGVVRPVDDAFWRRTWSRCRS